MNLHTCIFTSYWTLLISLHCPVGCAYPDASIPTEKRSESALDFLLLFIRFCSSSSLHQSLWNLGKSKRQQARHSAVCSMSTLISSVAGRKRARVLSWQCSDGLKEKKPGPARNSCKISWTLEYGEVALTPGQLSVLLLGANCIVGDSVNMWSIWRAVVNNYCTLQRGYLYHKHGVCNMSPSSVLSLAQDKWLLVCAPRCQQTSAS